MADALPSRVTTASRNYAISQTEFHSHWSRIMEMTDRNSFMFLLQCDCHRTDNFSNICYRNFQTKRQMLKSLMLGHTHMDGRTDAASPQSVLLSLCKRYCQVFSFQSNQTNGIENSKNVNAADSEYGTW